MKNRNLVTLVVAFMGAIKIVLQAFGIHILDNTDVNNVANDIAGFLFLGGVFMVHLRGPWTWTRIKTDFIGLFKGRNPVTLTIALLGALKLLLQAFGIDIITDATTNMVVNIVSALVGLYGIPAMHLKLFPVNKQAQPAATK